VLKVSVVINDFNYGRYLGRAIRSVLAQEFPADAMELIVVDDGSTDDSRAQAAAFGARVRYHYQENRGQAGALNRGFELARAPYVALLDADDFWHPGKLREVVAAFDADPSLGMVQHWLEDVDAAGRSLPTFLEPWPARYTAADFREGRTRFVGTSGLTFRKSTTEKILPIPGDAPYADEYLYFTLFEGDAGNISRTLGCHCIHGTNLYAETLLKPRSLAVRIRGRLAMDRHLEARSRAHGARAPEALLLASARERLLCELFLERMEGRWKEAWRRRQALLATYPAGGYRGFKGLTLLLAWLSPGLYAALFGIYRSTLLPGRLRRRWMPAAETE